LRAGRGAGRRRAPGGALELGADDGEHAHRARAEHDHGVAAADLGEDLPRASLLPVGRSGRAASSLAGDLHDQLDQLEHEAGVRRQP